MGKLWAVIQREFLERVRTRWFVIATLLAPLVFGTLIFLPAWLAMRNTSSAGAADIVILDATGVGLGDRVDELLHAPGASPLEPPLTGNTQVRVIARGNRSELAAAESLAAREVMQKRTQGYLRLDARAIRGDSAFYAGRNATSVADVRRIESATRQAALAIRLEREGLAPARIDSLTRPRLQLATERLSERGREGSGTASAVFAVAVAFLLYTSILLYGQNVLRSVIEEKQSRVAEVVVSSVRPETLLAGKVIGVGAVGLLQQLIWVAATAYIGVWAAPFVVRMGAAATGPAGTRVTTEASESAIAAALPAVSPGAIALILTFFLLGFLFYSSLYAAVGATVNSEQEAQQAVGPIMIFVVGSAILIAPVKMNPAGGLAQAASLFPFSSPIIMPLRMSLTTVPPIEMALSIAFLVLACVGAVWLAARIYRVGLLMYGKRPSFGEVMRWVRYAR